MIRPILMLGLAMLTLRGQTPDPAYGPLEKAYNALRARQYEAAIASFRRAIDAAPERASIRKDLAYAYLKIGETAQARDQFAEAMRLDSNDAQAALEYAFLCHETGKTAEARRIFDRLRKTADPQFRATAERAFENIDTPLAKGISRWSAALKLSPEDFSAHLELARLAEKRDDLPLAAEHYEKAWRLRPELRSLLVDLGRVLKAMGATERANAALLAASRGAEPRAAEAARELLPSRYPYVYEFRLAIELDPGNEALRQELGYLLEAMNRQKEARKAGLVADAKTLADRSYRAGYLKDALKYYLAAHESDPLDFPVMLRLGWTYNMLGQDKEAVRWFAMACKSPDAAIRSEAETAYRNLSLPLARYRTTVWLYPMWSSRWKDMFSYGQVKTGMKLGPLPLRMYLSTRFVGDTRGVSSEASPQYLSESSVILGAGLATSYWYGFMLWAEAGSAINYSGSRAGRPRTAPDYRGGLTFSQGAGKLLGTSSHGFFAETGGDAVFISRFQNDVVMYLQNRFGYTLPTAAFLGGLETQFYWNANPATDIRKEYWANVVEFGPGFRFRWKGMPSSCVFSINFLRGAYTRNEGNPRGPNYYDARVGIWYAVSR